MSFTCSISLSICMSDIFTNGLLPGFYLNAAHAKAVSLALWNRLDGWMLLSSNGYTIPIYHLHRFAHTIIEPDCTTPQNLIMFKDALYYVFIRYILLLEQKNRKKV
ncbi:unnamed protein product [Cuscuta epithymum]|uniref:Uncharacterized protein n=1 Tax=Cuscuta epithymum TaxID=186058 RepID=A0AAV0CB42_9ASTE|nr:unnamed protein product [Cuscuta epithymum]